MVWNKGTAKLRMLRCSTCQYLFIRSNGKIKDTKKRHGNTPPFCSRDCFNLFQQHITRPYNYCKHCNRRFRLLTNGKSRSIGITCSIKCRRFYENENELGRVAWNKGIIFKTEEVKKENRVKYILEHRNVANQRAQDWYKINFKKKKEYDVMYLKINPEKYLQRNIKQLKKNASPFKLPHYAYLNGLIAWSKVIKKRDKSCVICGSTDRLNAHHLIHKKYLPELSLNVNNGILLCKVHHFEVHGKRDLSQ